ncbi:hypothetical protein DFH94DRAFT_286373 [Russula ochroleuca]|uniref:Uncharacterized protein n=1 Tax=Russula ochroleuca TaxID=152965 RepID=A0A9P5JXZ5_9AGAM|nr:hypothetical protein DFH94DRAFT_286373 [Russula ochroleuca]
MLLQMMVHELVACAQISCLIILSHGLFPPPECALSDHLIVSVPPDCIPFPLSLHSSRMHHMNIHISCSHIMFRSTQAEEAEQCTRSSTCYQISILMILHCRRSRDMTISSISARVPPH